MKTTFRAKVSARWVAAPLALFMLSSAIGGGSQQLTEVVRQVMPTVFHLEAKMARGKAVGSGVVIREDGLALTAAHVVDKSTSLEATFSDGKRFPVEIITKDSAKDYAILRVRGTRFKGATLGRARSLEPGQDIFVIGSPKGLRFSVSKGIVSALRDNHIQTDTAINPGNSGGPVFTTEGKLVGIVNFGLKSTEGLKFCLMVDAISASGIPRSTGTSSTGSSSSSSSSTASPDAGRWFLVATKDRKTQKLIEASGALSENIKWLEKYPGYSIDTVGKGAKGWVFVLSEDSDYSDQDYTVSSTFPRDWVKKNWDAKKAITSVARGRGKWIVVMSKTKRFSKQAYRLHDEFDRNYVKGKADEGFVLTDVDSDKDYVLHVVSKFSDDRVQTTTYISSSVPTKDIRDSWDNDYRVLAVGYLEKERKWVIGMTKGVRMGEQAFYEGPDIPKSWIQERWDDGYSISAIR